MSKIMPGIQHSLRYDVIIILAEIIKIIKDLEFVVNVRIQSTCYFEGIKVSLFLLQFHRQWKVIGSTNIQHSLRQRTYF